MESRDPHDEGEAKKEEEMAEEKAEEKVEEKAEEGEELDSLPAADEEPPSASPSLPPLESVPALSSPSPSAAPSLRSRIVNNPASFFFRAPTTTASDHQSVDSPSDPPRNILPASEGQVIDLGSSSVAPGQHVDRGTGQPETSNLDRERGITAVVGRFRRRICQRLGSLVSMVRAVIKAIYYFFSLLIGLFFLPIWSFRTAYRIAPKLLRLFRRGRDAVRLRSYLFFKGVFDRVHPWVCGNRIGRKQAWNFLVRLSKGCFWSLYVCIVLSSLVGASSFVAFLIVLKVVDAPIRMTEELNFDYALPRPQAFVPITASDGCLVSDDLDVLRLVHPKHKFQLAILLTLPESDYNKNVGIFQVRAELLTSDGNISSSSWRPCMLRIKSFRFRLLEMFLKPVSMLVGYSSESQVLKVQMKGLTEGRKPTVCIRVTLEQRTGSKAGAGIPEVYSAYMKLESDLPLMKRVIWNWKITLFIWTTMAVFNLQLLTLLVCFRPILLPRVRRVDLPATPPSSGGNDHPSLPAT